MKITQIQVDNFLGLRSINLRLDTAITLICGPNGAGKSSLREAVRMAITRADVRDVKLKKDYGKLVLEGSKAGGAMVIVDGGDSFSFNMPAGSFAGAEVQESMRVALDGQRFSRMTPDERRSFLFDLTGCRDTADSVRAALVERKVHADKIEQVIPMLRTGFPAACDFAKQKATEEKGSWRAVTGETYGAKKAETWKAEKPLEAPQDIPALKSALAAIDTELAEVNKQSGVLASEARAAVEATAMRQALEEKAKAASTIRDNLERAKAELAEFKPKVESLRQRAKGAARVGLVHDLAFALGGLINERQPLGIDRETYQKGLHALEKYETEHGDIDSASAPDDEARAALPEHEKGLTVLQNRVKNLQRDLDTANAARAQLDASFSGEKPEVDPQEALLKCQESAKVIKAKRDQAQATLRNAEELARKQAEADGKTSKASIHHAEVLAWTEIADALAPDGIPSDLLAKALAPINVALTTAAVDTGWPRVNIEPDMCITAAGRDYSLLSESEQWRVDAMIAQTVAKVSGLKILMLDRMDVLDIPGRMALLTWLDWLANDGHLDTAILFGTLKTLPSGLPSSITAHWIENGTIAQLKQAA